MKCKATTAKRKPCSKYAANGKLYCHIHTMSDIGASLNEIIIDNAMMKSDDMAEASERIKSIEVPFGKVYPGIEATFNFGNADIVIDIANIWPSIMHLSPEIMGVTIWVRKQRLIQQKVTCCVGYKDIRKMSENIFYDYSTIDKIPTSDIILYAETHVDAIKDKILNALMVVSPNNYRLYLEGPIYKNNEKVFNMYDSRASDIIQAYKDLPDKNVLFGVINTDKSISIEYVGVAMLLGMHNPTIDVNMAAVCSSIDGITKVYMNYTWLECKTFLEHDIHQLMTDPSEIESTLGVHVYKALIQYKDKHTVDHAVAINMRDFSVEDKLNALDLRILMAITLDIVDKDVLTERWNLSASLSRKPFNELVNKLVYSLN